jgi:hypothetical protein
MKIFDPAAQNIHGRGMKDIIAELAAWASKSLETLVLWTSLASKLESLRHQPLHPPEGVQKTEVMERIDATVKMTARMAEEKQYVLVRLHATLAADIFLSPNPKSSLLDMAIGIQKLIVAQGRGITELPRALHVKMAAALKMAPATGQMLTDRRGRSLHLDGKDKKEKKEGAKKEKKEHKSKSSSKKTHH